MSRALRRRYGRARHTHEVVARRHTADGVLVQFWSDGAITVGHEMQNRVVAKAVPKDALWAVAGDVSLYDASEVSALVRAARKAPGDVTAVRLAMRAHAPKRSTAADLTDAQREAILASQKRTQWFDPQTGILQYAPGFLPSEQRRRR